MRWKKQNNVEPGDKVAIVNPVHPKEVVHGRLVAFRDGGRTARVQDPYEWRTRSVPAEYIYPDH